jgi:hypothetical protein
MALVIISFCVVFLLIASGGLLLFYREALPKRIAEAINPRPKQRSLMTTIKETGFSLGGAVEHFEHLLPKSQAEISIVLQRLTRAGYRSESAVKVFYGCKVFVRFGFCLQSGKPQSFFRVCCSAGTGVSGAGLLARAPD